MITRLSVLVFALFASATVASASGDDGIVIISPESAAAEIPDFAGTLVAVVNQKRRPLRFVNLEDAVQKEFARRGASVVRTPAGYAGNPCDIGRPVICLVILDPVEGYLEGRGGYDGYGSNGRNGHWRSSGSSNGSFRNWSVSVVVELWLGDGSAPQTIGGAAKNFTVTLNSRSRSYYSTSSRKKSGGYRYSWGSGYNSQQGDDFAGRAIRAARKAAEALPKKKKFWSPGAAELVRGAFHR